MELGNLMSKHSTDFITLYGVSVSLETIDFTGTVDDFGDTPETYSTSTIKVLFQNDIKNDLWTKQGLLEQGDAIVYFKSSDSVKIRDKLIKSNIEYDIVSIELGEFQGITGFQKAACKRNNTGQLAMYTIYYGESTNTSLTEAQVKALRANNLYAKYESIYSLIAGGYKYIAIHPTLGTPTAFKDSDTGYAIAMEAAVVVAITVSGVTANYNVYRTTNILGGAIDIEVI